MERLPLFDENFTKEFLSPHIQRIAKVVSEQFDLMSQPGWMTGLAGMAVFLGEYEGGEVYNRPARKPTCSGILQKIINMINDGFTYPTLAAGLAGIVWAFRYLGERKLIDSHDAQILDELIPFIQRFVEHEFKNSNIDALHGGIGPGLVGLMGCENMQSSDGSEAGSFRDLVSKILDEKDLDLGLAHGLPSLILYLSECHSCEGWNLLASSLTRLLSHADLTQKNGSVFPTRLIDGKTQYPSRMAWCYGDVGIGMGLLSVAQSLNVAKVQKPAPDWIQGSKVFDYAIDVLLRAAERRDLMNTRIIDPYFCHGTSGLAFMFYKAWRLSKNDKLKEAAQYWTMETIRFLETTHPIGKVYTNEGMAFGDGSLLNGLSGIGLSLLAIEQGLLLGWEKGLLI